MRLDSSAAKEEVQRWLRDDCGLGPDEARIAVQQGAEMARGHGMSGLVPTKQVLDRIVSSFEARRAGAGARWRGMVAGLLGGTALDGVRHLRSLGCDVGASAVAPSVTPAVAPTPAPVIAPQADAADQAGDLMVLGDLTEIDQLTFIDEPSLVDPSVPGIAPVSAPIPAAPEPAQIDAGPKLDFGPLTDGLLDDYPDDEEPASDEGGLLPGSGDASAAPAISDDDDGLDIELDLDDLLDDDSIDLDDDMMDNPPPTAGN